MIRRALLAGLFVLAGCGAAAPGPIPQFLAPRMAATANLLRLLHATPLPVPGTLSRFRDDAPVEISRQGATLADVWLRWQGPPTERSWQRQGGWVAIFRYPTVEQSAARFERIRPTEEKRQMTRPPLDLAGIGDEAYQVKPGGVDPDAVVGAGIRGEVGFRRCSAVVIYASDALTRSTAAYLRRLDQQLAADACP
ncbi:MAG TPA: hypothetical protein VGE07_12800 [Herpetosiphonaceae bacterium]